MIGGLVQRPAPGVDPPSRAARWVDTLGHDSDYDYDPLWQRCVELGVSPTFHSAAMGWGSRTSPTNYVYNHIGIFAAAGEALCRSLFLGGVPHRFPELRFAFLEGGVAWAASLSPISSATGRSATATPSSTTTPRTSTAASCATLFERVRRRRAAAPDLDELDAGLSRPEPARRAPRPLDEFAALAASASPTTSRDMFDRASTSGARPTTR